MLKTVGNPSTRYGDQTIVDGNIVIGTSGKGIDFSATPGAGTSELLDDYEEGTWSPTLTPYAGAFGAAATTAGRYTKVGRLVTVHFKGVINDNGTGNTLLVVGNLPFAPDKTGIDLFAGTCIKYFVAGGLYVAWWDGGLAFLIGTASYTYPGSTGGEFYGTITYITAA